MSIGRARMNKGKPSGTFIAQIGNWNLYQTADSRYKVAAIDPVNGKANYTFNVSNGKVATDLDHSHLSEARPELLESINAYFKSLQPVVVSDESDPYGDLALQRKRKLTPEQNWRRGLLQLKRIELEHTAAKQESIMESAVRMLWIGVFKEKISDAEMEKALTWIRAHGSIVDLKSLLQVEQDFYAGKYAPHSCATLEAQFELIGGTDGSNEEDDYAAFR
jgi:hypothetical protein